MLERNHSELIESIEGVIESGGLLHTTHNSTKEPIDIRLLGEVEAMVDCLEEYESQTAGGMLALENALCVLRMRNRYATTESIQIAHAHLQDTWRAVAPRLRELVARTPKTDC